MNPGQGVSDSTGNRDAGTGTIIDSFKETRWGKTAAIGPIRLNMAVTSLN
jgi:hypothetical protein